MTSRTDSETKCLVDPSSSWVNRSKLWHSKTNVAIPKCGKVPDVGLNAAISPTAQSDLISHFQPLRSYFTMRLALTSRQQSQRGNRQ